MRGRRELTMPWETRRIPVKSPLTITEAPNANVLAAALRIIEEPDGVRRGWNGQPRLFTLRLAGPALVEMSFVPGRLWNGMGRNPADAVWATGRLLPVVPSLVEPASYEGKAICAVGMLFEGWNRPPGL